MSDFDWKKQREKTAFLALADGSVFRGWGFGGGEDTVGEVVFNTGMCGYQEIVSDPSYAGQFVTLTAPEMDVSDTASPVTVSSMVYVPSPLDVTVLLCAGSSPAAALAGCVNTSAGMVSPTSISKARSRLRIFLPVCFMLSTSLP